ncbi:MAG: O-antigen ligase family protein, partial [Chitinophagales bacterium]
MATKILKDNYQADKITGLSFTAIALFILVAPLFEGLFAPVEYLAVTVLFLPLAFLTLLNITVKHAWLLLLAGAVYLTINLASSLAGVDPGEGLIGFGRNLLYFAILIISLKIPPQRLGAIYRLVFISGILVALIGFSPLATDFFLSNAMRAGRMQAVFGYANTTAIYLLVSIILGLSSIPWQGPKSFRCFGFAGIYLCSTALCFTGSRAVWLLWPVSMLLSYILAGKEDKTWWALPAPLFCLFSAVVGLLSYSQYSSHHLTYSLLILLSGLVILPFLAVMIQDRRREKSGISLWMRHILAIVLPGLLGLFLIYTADLGSRAISTGASEFLGRLIYYKDALSIIGDYPWLGTGSAGWASLQFQYQTAYYNVALVHSSILQTALDSGLPGLLFFLLIIGLSCSQWFKVRKAILSSAQYRYLWPALVAG